MTKMLFDFTCPNNHTSEHLVTSDTRELLCPVCGHIAKRITSPVSSIFKGSGFPTADDKWAREHERLAKPN